MNIFDVRHFWKKKIVIDVILLTLISIFALLTFNYFNSKSDFFSVYLSLTVGLLIVWLTFRIIDELLNKRKILFEFRERVIEELERIITTFEIDLLSISKLNNQILKRKLSTYRAKFTEKKYYLNDTESDKINRILTKLSLIQSEYSNLLFRKNDFANSEMNFTESDYNKAKLNTENIVVNYLKNIEEIQLELIAEMNERTMWIKK